MFLVILAIIFVFGLAVGSFLNVVIYRLPRESANWRIVNSRSRCPRCQKNLQWFELVPLVSFIIQRGRCRSCGTKISPQYPLVELAAGLAFLSVFWRVIVLEPGHLSFTAPLSSQAFWLYFLAALWCFYGAVLIIVFVYDLKHYLIPDKVIFPAIMAAFVFNFSLDVLPRFLKDSAFPAIDLSSRLPYQSGGIKPDFLISGVVAAFLFSSFFFVLFWMSRGRWLGFGDVKLAAFLGLILGFPAVILGAFWSFLLGSLIGIVLIIFKKKRLKSEIPFGPFLCLGAWLTFLFGFKFFEWYNNLPYTIIDYF